MKFWILIFSIALFAGGTCLGVALMPRIAPPQPEPPKAVETSWGGGYSREMSVTKFVRELGLSDEQDREFDHILGETQNEMHALGRAMRAAQERSRERVTAILTEEQKKKLDSLISEERQKRSDSEMAQKVATYQKLLGLSETETQAFRDALKEHRSARYEYFRHRHRGDSSDYRAVMKDARDRQNESIKNVFTEEHYARYIELSELENH